MFKIVEKLHFERYNEIDQKYRTWVTWVTSLSVKRIVRTEADLQIQRNLRRRRALCSPLKVISYKMVLSSSEIVFPLPLDLRVDLYIKYTITRRELFSL